MDDELNSFINEHLPSVEEIEKYSKIINDLKIVNPNVIIQVIDDNHIAVFGDFILPEGFVFDDGLLTCLDTNTSIVVYNENQYKDLFANSVSKSNSKYTFSYIVGKLKEENMDSLILIIDDDPDKYKLLICGDFKIPSDFELIDNYIVYDGIEVLVSSEFEYDENNKEMETFFKSLIFEEIVNMLKMFNPSFSFKYTKSEFLITIMDGDISKLKVPKIVDFDNNEIRFLGFRFPLQQMLVDDFISIPSKISENSIPFSSEENDMYNEDRCKRFLCIKLFMTLKHSNPGSEFVISYDTENEKNYALYTKNNIYKIYDLPEGFIYDRNSMSFIYQESWKEVFRVNVYNAEKLPMSIPLSSFEPNNNDDMYTYEGVYIGKKSLMDVLGDDYDSIKGTGAMYTLEDIVNTLYSDLSKKIKRGDIFKDDCTYDFDSLYMKCKILHSSGFYPYLLMVFEQYEKDLSHSCYREHNLEIIESIKNNLIQKKSRSRKYH